MTLEQILGSIVLVALIQVVAELLKKWRSKGERQTQSFQEMQQIAAAYKDVVEIHKTAALDATNALRSVTHDLAEAQTEINSLRIKVISLETALEDAHDMVGKMLELVKSLDIPH